MAEEDKAENKAEELKGQAKEKVGEVTGNEQWQAEGKAEQAKGNLKQAGEKVKDALSGNKNKSGNNHKPGNKNKSGDKDADDS